MNIEKLRVLVVDDNANMRRLVHTILRSLGVTDTMEAEGGAEALAILQTWPADLALVDYVMEGMDGAEFTRAVRRDHDRPDRYLPIVIITGYAELWRLTEAKRAGADDFIVKPFTTKTLVQRIMRAASGSMRPSAELSSTG